MMKPGAMGWFAAHELRLSWRELTSLLTAGRRRRMMAIVIGVVVFAAFMHGLAFLIVGNFARESGPPRPSTLLYATAIGLLSLSLMVSQALEAVTRAFYQRADFDMILSSPVDQRMVYSIRISAVGLSVTAMAILLAASFINILAWTGGPRWLLIYGVVFAGGLAATAVAVLMTVVMFKTIGPKRTRIVSQVLAAIIGAMFVIGLQGAAVLSYGTISRFAILQSEWVGSHLPALDSAFWMPARAMLGDPVALAETLAVGFALFFVTIALFAGGFGEQAIAASSANAFRPRLRRSRGRFRATSAMQALRRKEWVLLYRDPWLISQTLMQLLYLLPPALLLWQNFGDDGDAVIVLVPVLVVAAGQLAGGLAWLAVSGEDAPDLVATAPVSQRQVIRAKIEAVLISIAVVATPLILVMAIETPWAALATAVFSAIAAIAATAVQLIFRTQAKRSHFRRRQTSSRFATFAEALSSMAWAATAGLVAAGTWVAVGSAVAALAVLLAAWLIRPRPVPARALARPGG